MSLVGFDKDRHALKNRCPRIYQEVTCEGHDRCPVHNCVRTKLSQDRRIFTPIARSSYKWKRIYAKRTAVGAEDATMQMARCCFSLDNGQQNCIMLSAYS